MAAGSATALDELAKAFAIPFMIDTLPPPFPGLETVAARAPPVLRDPNAAPPTTRESAPRQATIGLRRSRNVAVWRGRCRRGARPTMRGTSRAPSAYPEIRRVQWDCRACAPRGRARPVVARRPSRCSRACHRARRVNGVSISSWGAGTSTGPQRASGRDDNPSVVDVASVDKARPLPPVLFRVVGTVRQELQHPDPDPDPDPPRLREPECLPGPGEVGRPRRGSAAVRARCPGGRQRVPKIPGEFQCGVSTCR